MDFKRKINGLERELHCYKTMYFLTLCCLDGRQIFKDARIVHSVLKRLRLCCETHRFKNYVYCFMPDHLHMLLEGEEGSNLIKMIKQFKQLTGYYFKQDSGRGLWQKSYYDHILRKQEDVVSIVRYILENPVRKGLVKHPDEYPFSGSFEFEKEIFNL